MKYALMDILRNYAGVPNAKHRLREHEFWALRDISFSMNHGESLAVVGPNGAGKSSLLKLIQGIYEPDEGRIFVHGRMTELVEIGTSFHYDYTGRENIWINATVLGLDDKAIRERMDDIIDFASIGEFMDTPVKYYSTGMKLRLAFSIAVHCYTELLLIDEVLSVGDTAFVKKCKEKIASFIRQGGSMILVTHNLLMAQELCERALWIQQGSLLADGNCRSIVRQYTSGQPDNHGNSSSDASSHKEPSATSKALSGR